MANTNDQHDEPFIIWLVQNSVVADPQSVAIVAAAEFHRIGRARLIRQAIDGRCEPFPHVRRKSVELTSG
jgi:hypothetical protein